MAAPKLSTADIVSRLDELPTLPSVVYKLGQVINNPMSSTKDVEQVMQSDVSMTAKILRIANSPYYAIPGGVTSLSRAIAYIGYDTIQQLVLCSSIFESLGQDQHDTFDITGFWKHSFAVAIAAETIAQTVGHPLSSDIFTCGLVHDLGKVAIYAVGGNMIAEISKYAAANDLTSLEAERQLYNIDHTEIGQALVEKWKLPVQLQATTRYHHEADPKKRFGLSVEVNQTVDMVLLADLCIHALNFGFSGHRKITGIPKEVLLRLMISPEQGLKTLLKTIRDGLGRAEEFIKVIGSHHAA